jgi:hypothetical protein
MPKRKRNRTPATAPAAAPGPLPSIDAPPVVDPAVAMFAERHRAQQEADRRAKQQEREARREAERISALARTKDEAAARLKAVRRQEVIAPGEVEAAEAAYTAATADLVEAETGERPSWAPPRPEPALESTEVESTEPDQDDEPTETSENDRAV